MRPRRINFAISTIFVVVAMSAISASARAELWRDTSARSTSPFVQSAEVATLYRVHCQMCHGPGGKAPIPEFAFVGRKWKHGTKSVEMAKIITNGVAGTPMMAFKNKLTSDQITALARHVRAFDKTLPPEK